MSAEQREEAVFEAALQLPADQRAAYLDDVCAGDADLRRRVDVLLGAFERAGGFMKQAATPDRTVRFSLPPTEKPGDRIGRYKLLEQIGEGGCGVVYMAEQEEPVRRRVALKVIKLGMDTKQVIARFEAERQALAMMDHPNIAKIFDAGVTGTSVVGQASRLSPGRLARESATAGETPAEAGGTPAPLLSPGRPYFVMELVRGIRITDFCDENKLSTEDRLKLFIQVCQAVQHAHQKGIIHRDIKPSNILVAINEPGAPGVPKVIDFGIAKATQGRLTDQTLFTAFEQFIGTPAYMSPEQAQLTALDIDTRSDIYSLGVLLYELLTGKTPFDAKELLAAGLDEMRRTIREVEPVKPSTRLTQEIVGDDVRRLHSNSENRDPKSEEEIRASSRRLLQAKELIHALRGDLDWIVMKCLEKDRARRYETANGVAMDVQRHLSCEPVIARPPSRLYEFQKTVLRHKFGFAAAAVLITVLAGGVLVSTLQAVRATKAEREQSRLRELAQQAEAEQGRMRTQAEAARVKAQANEQKAQTEAARSTQVAQFMKDMLKGAGPAVALGRNTELLREILDDTAGRLGRDLINQPAVEADLRETLGVVYRDIGQYTNAEAMLLESLRLRKQLESEESLAMAAVLDNLGQVLHRAVRSKEAERYYREALRIREELSGHENEDVATTLANLGSLLRSQGQRDEAEAKLREALDLRKRLLPPDHPEIASSLGNLGLVLAAQGKLEEAESRHREAFALRKKLFPPDHPQIADSLAQLAGTLASRGKLADAETNYLAALTIQKKVLGDHRDTAITLNQLGSLLVTQGRLPEAERHFKEASDMQRKVFGETQADFSKLADVLARQGKLAEFDSLFRESQRSPQPAALASLAYRLRQAGKGDESEAAYRKALELQIKLHGRKSSEAARAMTDLSMQLVTQRKLEEAETVAREAFATQKELLGYESAGVSGALQHLGGALAAQGKLAEAEESLREAIAMYERLGLKDWGQAYWAHTGLGGVFYRQGKFADAEKHYSEAMALWRQRGDDTFASSVVRLATALEAQGKHTEAQNLYREEVSRRRELRGDQDPVAASWRINWGMLLHAQGRLSEAAALFRMGAEHASPNTLNDVAWLLAVSPDSKLRDGTNAVAFAEKAVAATGRTNAMYLDTLAAAYAEAGQFTNAMRVQREAIALVPTNQQSLKVELDMHLRLFESNTPYREDGELATKTSNLLTQGKFADAEPLARECLTLREKQIPDEWRTFNAKSMLGGALLGQKKYAEAEPLLLSGYEGMKQREATIPAAGKVRLKEGLERLVQLYEETNRPDQAAPWKHKLAEFDKAAR